MSIVFAPSCSQLMYKPELGEKQLIFIPAKSTAKYMEGFSKPQVKRKWRLEKLIG